jgi:hypothetical protein
MGVFLRGELAALLSLLDCKGLSDAQLFSTASEMARLQQNYFYKGDIGRPMEASDETANG